jgi:hypothetical protein
MRMTDIKTEGGVELRTRLGQMKGSPLHIENCTLSPVSQAESRPETPGEGSKESCVAPCMWQEVAEALWLKDTWY